MEKAGTPRFCNLKNDKQSSHCCSLGLPHQCHNSNTQTQGNTTQPKDKANLEKNNKGGIQTIRRRGIHVCIYIL